MHYDPVKHSKINFSIACFAKLNHTSTKFIIVASAQRAIFFKCVYENT